MLAVRVRKLPIVDLLSLLLIVVIGVDLIQVNRRLHRIETERIGDDLDGARMLPMPARTLALQPVTIASGAPRLIFYMSPGCGVCAKNMPLWAATAQSVGRQNVLILVADDQWAEAVPAYLAKYNMAEFPVVVAERDFVKRYAMHEIPRTVLVRDDGKVEHVWRGTIAAPAVVAAWNSLRK